MPKRYMVAGGSDQEGTPLPPFIVEVADDAEEPSIKNREDAQEKYLAGDDQDEVATFLGGSVVEE